MNITTSQSCNNVIDMVRERLNNLGNDCETAILYGSYARGDYNEDSDIDIAILTPKPYADMSDLYNRLGDLASDIGIETFQVVNFSCIPSKDFYLKKKWYVYYQNISKDGKVIYGRYRQ